MKSIPLLFILIPNLAFALQLSDPTTVCETKTATIAVESFAHCKEGDLIQVSAYDLKGRCKVNSPIVQAGQEYLCIYRGEKRTVRERPLSPAEKAFDKEQVENLVKKYSN